MRKETGGLAELRDFVDSAEDGDHPTEYTPLRPEVCPLFLSLAVRPIHRAALADQFEWQENVAHVLLRESRVQFNTLLFDEMAK